MFSNLNKDYIRSHYKGDAIGAIRYVRSETGADVKTAKVFVDEVFKEQEENGGNNKIETLTLGIKEKSFYKENYYTESIEAELKDILEKRRAQKKRTYNTSANRNVYGNLEKDVGNTNILQKIFKLILKIITGIVSVFLILLCAAISAVIWGLYLLIAIGGLCVVLEIALYVVNTFAYIGNYYSAILTISVIIYFVALIIAVIYSIVATIKGKNPWPITSERKGNEESLGDMFKRWAKEDYEIRRRVRIAEGERRNIERKREIFESYKKHDKKW